MYSLPGTDLVPSIIAAAGVAVIPANVDWLLHRAVTGLSGDDRAALESVFGCLDVHDSGECGERSSAVAASWAAVLSSDLVTPRGQGVLAVWQVDAEPLVRWRRQLLRLDGAVVTALVQAGKRLTTMSATVVKNAETAAASWGSSTTSGEVLLPTVRQPLVAVLR